MTYQEFKKAVIGIAVEKQISDYELYYTEGDAASVEIFKEEIKSYKTESSKGICFRCIVDGKAGYASTENLTEEEAESLVIRALENAKSIESSEQSFLHNTGDTYAVCEADTTSVPTGGCGNGDSEGNVPCGYSCGRRYADGFRTWTGSLCTV